MISSGISSKILKEALIQQKEVLEETEEPKKNAFVFSEEDQSKQQVEEEEEDIDEFGGFSETQSQFGNHEVCDMLFVLNLFILSQIGRFYPMKNDIPNKRNRACILELVTSWIVI